MIEAIGRLSQRLENDPFFLASVLHSYVISQGIDATSLAQQLGCDVQALGIIGICRRPNLENFRSDVFQIAQRFNLNVEALAEIVRHVDSLKILRFAQPESALLMAARDATEQLPDGNGALDFSDQEQK